MAGAKSTKRARPTRARAKPIAPPPAAAVDLDAIRRALDANDAPAALASALAAWRQTRATTLADLVEAISERIPHAPIAGDTAWSSIARGQDPATLGGLLAALPERAVSFLPTAGGLLAAFPDDPRLARAVATWALDPITTSSSTYPFWTKVLDAVARGGDVRVIPVLEKRLAQRAGKSQFWPKFYAALTKVIARLDEAPRAPVAAKLVAPLARAAGKLTATAAAPVPARRPSASAPNLAGAPLADATAHLTAGRVQPAIDAMLASWRQHRIPAIADRVERASELLPSRGRALGVTDQAAHPAWLAAFDADPQAALPQLLEHVMVGGPAGAEEHLVRLGELPDDPRIARRLAELCARHAASPERTQFWKALLELLARIADPRVAPALCVAFSDFTGTYYNHHRQARRILGSWALEPPAPRPLEAAEIADLKRLDAALAKLEDARDVTEDQLLQAIAVAWRDDGPRLVYADWLAERDHARGEVIVLSCKQPRTAAETKRLSEINRKTTCLYGWLDDVGARWSPTNLGIDRGLPTAINVEWSTSTLFWQRLRTEPLRAVLERISLESRGDDDRNLPPHADLAAVLLDPVARRLATVDAVPPNYLAQLGELVRGHWKPRGKQLVRA